MTLIEKNLANTVQSVDLNTINVLRELSNDASKFQAQGRVIGDFSNIETLKNTYLKSGDEIFIPKYTSTITVVGEVMNPGSMLWENKKNISYYIERPQA